MTRRNGGIGMSSLNHRSTEVKELERWPAILDDLSQFSERGFREIIDALPAAIYTTDAKGRLTHFNPACVELSGRTPELGSDHWCVTWKLYHPDGTPMPHDECPMAIALKEGRVVRGAEAIAERPDGTRIWFQPYPTPLRDAEGRIIGGINMLVDITERKRAEESLRESEERYRQLATLLPVAVYTCDASGLITYYNPKAAELWGRAPKPGNSDERFCGSEQMVLDNGQVLPHDQCPMAVALRDGSSFRQAPVNVRRPDGSMIRVRVNIEPIKDVGGRIVGAINVFSDVTELRRAEQALRENDRRKDEFLAMLAHELRNPLAPIRNAAQVLKITGPTDANQQWACEVIERQTQHLTRLVDDLLDVSRITQGKIILQREPLELSTIINRAVEASRPLVEARRHQLTITLPPEPALVEGDLTRLVQVVSNLVNNAAKYTDEGGYIRLDAAVEGGEVVVRVRDNGMGIPAVLLPHVFDMFMQADRLFDRSLGGLGIGLTLVRRLVEMHGGRVEAQSEGPGRGSEFILRLPRAQVQASASGARRTEVSTTNAGRQTPLRVLVVEDNVDSAQMMGFVLKLGGHETRLAYDGPAALDAARAFQPQVILCDIGLPGMDGYEVAQQLRAQPEFKQARLIALSGYGQDEDRRRAKEAGFDYHLTKPVEPDALTALLDSLHPDAYTVKCEAR